MDSRILLGAAVTLSSLQYVRCDDVDSSSGEEHHDGGQFWVGFFGGVILTVIITLIVRCCRRRQMKKKGWKLCRHGECARCDLEQPLILQTPQQVYLPQGVMMQPQMMPAQQPMNQPALYPQNMFVAQPQPTARVN